MRLKIRNDWDTKNILVEPKRGAWCETNPAVLLKEHPEMLLQWNINES